MSLDAVEWSSLQNESTVDIFLVFPYSVRYNSILLKEED